MNLINFLILMCFVFSTNSLDNRESFYSEYSLKKNNLLGDEKKQSWGTCWTFSTICSVESAILSQSGRLEFILSEYYIDKYNGFNKRSLLEKTNEIFEGSNTDDINSGLKVHHGGDFSISAAFNAWNAGFPSEIKGQYIENSENNIIFGGTQTSGIVKRNNQKVFAKHVDFIGLSSSNLIKRIKSRILKNGAVSSIEHFSENPIGYYKGLEVHYYDGAAKKMPDHAVNIVGWDDMYEMNGKKGAWLIRDSDHVNDKHEHIFYFYTPYSDYYTGRHNKMGAVSFREVIRTPIKKVHYYSLHGWQYETKNNNITKVANRFTIKKKERLYGVGIFTTKLNEITSVEIRKESHDGEILFVAQERFHYPGFHVIDISKVVDVSNVELYVITKNSSTQYAYDASFKMELLLSSYRNPVRINSSASPGESYYYDGSWKDFYYYKDYQSRKPRGVTRYGTNNFSIYLYTM